MSDNERDVEERLVFLLSAPRSGSTLLMRILNATSEVYARSEPHIFPPLAHLGFWECVDTAPYDQLQAQQAMRDIVQEFSDGEEGYYRACRAYTDHLYRRILMQTDKRYFLDKTPANALVLPFIQRVYPRAKYIVLTRHPAAILSSYAHSFFDGDYHAAHTFNPILSRYIPVLSDLIRSGMSNVQVVSYEQVVREPENTLAKLSEFMNISFEADALNYQKESVSEGLGDPIGVQKHQRPVTNSVDKWVAEFRDNAFPKSIVDAQLKGVSDIALETFGYPIDSLWDALSTGEEGQAPRPSGSINRYQLERKILVALRRDIHRRPHGRLVRKVRRFCDILLRG
ncbi:MAG: sulfotransferase [Myxococcota bacterium]|nr:sulfotransferase [Myxococcota bacterium]